MPATAASRPEPTGCGRRSSAVPVEFIGKARMLRDRIARAYDAWSAAADQLTAPLRPSGGFTPVFTRQSIAVTAARWRNLPQWGRLRPVASTNDRDRLSLGELRLIPFRTVMEAWDADELSVAIAAVSVGMARPSIFGLDLRLLAIVGLHALARRFERGADRRDLAVLRDLLPIIPAAPGILRAGGECEIAAADGGRWIGSRMGCDGRPVIGLRTFVA
jgi:hypothetical protein